ncbi:kinase-like domain-containing protein [Rhizophagus irregularis DAOM 181602=DAOM 197198]|nr:kinase-like domain-containing protein [Rhizophagus irregularis DAOM 181602=DAOM 197198]
MNDVVNEIFLLGKVDIHPNIIKLCEVSKFIGKVVNENIGIIVATKLIIDKKEKAYGVTPYIDPDNSLEIRIINGKREIPIPNTNSEYVKFYKRCWEFEPENLGNSFYS